MRSCFPSWQGISKSAGQRFGFFSSYFCPQRTRKKMEEEKKKTKNKKGGWKDLPNDLLVLLSRRLNEAHDFFRLGVVCKSWRSAFLHKNSTPSTFLPWLMLGGPLKTYRNTCLFKNLSDGKIHTLLLPDEESHVCGSSHGWLILHRDSDSKPTLFNPLSRSQVQLPLSLPECFKQRIFFPSPALPYEGLLISMPLLKRGQFTHFGTPFFVNCIYCKERLYTIDPYGHVAEFCFNGGLELPTETKIGKVPSHCFDFHLSWYLVEWEGELLAVDIDKSVCLSKIGSCSRRFFVFKLNQSGDGARWIEVKSLGDHSLFVGMACSFSFNVASSGLRKNSIYYVKEDSASKTVRVGVYSLEDQRVSLLENFGEVSVGDYDHEPILVAPSL